MEVFDTCLCSFLFLYLTLFCGLLLLAQLLAHVPELLPTTLDRGFNQRNSFAAVIYLLIREINLQ